MRVAITDGGRAAAGFKGEAGDCFARALAIAANMPYRAAYDLVNTVAKEVRLPKNARGHSSARTGVHTPVAREIMSRLGWSWVTTMQVGQGCRVHLRGNELPSGSIICRVSKHYVAVMDGVIHDTHDPSRGGRRCVYGYWQKASA
tara:strand:+ start:461 stop:895 length:435 start_codon:yes stop_codon:yes gene_type:complete